VLSQRVPANASGLDFAGTSSLRDPNADALILVGVRELATNLVTITGRCQPMDIPSEYPTLYFMKKLTVAGSRLIPVLAPQPLPMPMDRWCEEMETLSRVKEQIALLAAQERRSPLPWDP
jgi:hypothetical protein